MMMLTVMRLMMAAVMAADAHPALTLRPSYAYVSRPSLQFIFTMAPASF